MISNNETQTLVNLASPKMGTKIISVSDEFFGEATRMLSDQEPVFIEDKYDTHGKWMDGWESKRRRDGGNDWAIIKLGSPGIISTIEVDTSFFTGNFPPFFSLEGTDNKEIPKNDNEWIPLITKSSLIGDQKNNFNIESNMTVNYVRLQIFPDGGIARLRLFGKVNYDWSKLNSSELIELSSLNLGGSIITFNNAHYGDVSALLSEGRGKTMGDGWETRRRREPGNDWIIIKLAKKAMIKEIEIDTAHFKGNFPDRASIQAASVSEVVSSNENIIKDSEKWDLILGQMKLKADNVHKFSLDLNPQKEATHIRLNIYPDGGVSRLRIFGIILND